MLNRLSYIIAGQLYDSLDDAKKLENLNKGLDYKNLVNRLKVIIVSLALFAALLAIGLSLHITAELFWATLVFAIARKWNEGHHFKSPDVCFLVTLAVLLSIPTLNYFFSENVYLFAIVSFILNAIFAPFKYTTDKKYYFKKAVSLLACIASLWMGSLIIFAIFAQSVDLIHKVQFTK